MPRLRLCDIYVFVQPYGVFWSPWETNGRRNLIRLYGTSILSLLQWCIQCCASVFQYFNVFSSRSSLSTLCRTREATMKWLKKRTCFFCLFFCLTQTFLLNTSFSLHLLSPVVSVRVRRLREWKGEQSYCRLNLIKGRSAFKCLLFPWAKRLWGLSILASASCPNSTAARCN